MYAQPNSEARHRIQGAGFGAHTGVLSMQDFATAPPSIARWSHTTPFGLEFGVGRGRRYQPIDRTRYLGSGVDRMGIWAQPGRITDRRACGYSAAFAIVFAFHRIGCLPLSHKPIAA